MSQRKNFVKWFCLCWLMMLCGNAAAEQAAVDLLSSFVDKQLLVSEPQNSNSPPQSSDAAGGDAVRTISNVFVDTDIRQAIGDIATQAGKIIVIEDGVTGVISCELKNVTLEKALDIVLAGKSYTVLKKKDYYLICSSNPESVSFSNISKTKIIKLNYIVPSSAVKLLAKGFREYAQSDDASGVVCVTAPPTMLNRIASDLKLADRPPQHVLLDARIVVMEKTDLLNLGVTWSWPQIAAGAYNDSASNSQYGLRIGYTPDKQFTNALLMNLNLMSQNGEATVVASPQVMAQDSKEAEIKVLTEEYFKIVTDSGYYTRAELEKVETGTILKITPRIGDNGDITMEMKTEVSDVVARNTDNLPVITRRTSSNTVRIKDGGTAAIAGLKDNRSRSDVSQTPGLSGLPLVGKAFDNKASKNTTRQVAIFVTAYLVTDTGLSSSGKFASQEEFVPAGEEFKQQIKQNLSSVKNKNVPNKK